MFCTWGDFFRCSIAIEHFQIQSKLPDPGTFSAQTFKHLNIDKSLPGPGGSLTVEHSQLIVNRVRGHLWHSLVKILL